jgi:transposase
LTDIHYQGTGPIMMSESETMERKNPRGRRSFSPEFKAEIVELCRRGDGSIGPVARDFDLGETVVRAWVHQAETDAGERRGLTTEERTVLSSCAGRTGPCVRTT